MSQIVSVRLEYMISRCPSALLPCVHIDHMACANTIGYFSRSIPEVWKSLDVSHKLALIVINPSAQIYRATTTATASL